MDLIRALSESESKARSLVSRISELEGLIGEERAKWSGAQAVQHAGQAAAR